MCQRAVGNLFAAYADLEADQVEWTKGRPAIFESSTKAERGFCRDCGTPLSFAYKGQPYLSVTLGSLDDPELVPITRHLGVESKASWLMFSDGLPEKQTGESAAGAEMLEGMVSRQSPEGAA
jgi:hypothetical protein